ncbi:hypothetical protein Scep_030011 [Stephania cephalantha]|uniref:Uncharacterized protein n=1 Tax=Stephania cephalantha TaxID=152367 RepID=A0AAP0E1N9_9MAGN
MAGVAKQSGGRARAAQRRGVARCDGGRRVGVRATSDVGSAAASNAVNDAMALLYAGNQVKGSECFH